MKDFFRKDVVETLHQNALHAVSRYKNSESALIDALQAMDHEKAYFDLNYKSLYDYAVNALRLSQDVAYILITVARKSREYPALKQAIASKELSISNARRIAPILNPENETTWIEKAKSLTMDKLEKELATAYPKEAVPTKIKYIAEDTVSLTLSISEATLKKLKRVQDLLSQKKSQNVKLDEALEQSLDAFLEKHDPVKKAERLVARRVKRFVVKKTLQSGKNTRAPISAQTSHEINLRDQGQCTQITNGVRCAERRWLHIHHSHPVSLGGSNDPSNLVTLCAAHHKIHHAAAS